ncbi:MAG: zinc metallopeptidase [Bacilli bacterium]|nr:zinc metallopeptidase [Bacilli bacterium]
MTLGYENIATIGLFIIGFIAVLYAQTKMNNSYRKNKQIKNIQGKTGVEVARTILDANGLTSIYVVETRGELTDHYDPTRKVIKLSSAIFHGDSIAAASIAAHECGHAIQDKVGYTFMRIRSAIVPIVNSITYIGYFVSILSLFFGMIGYLKIGILMLLAALIFQLITLPVEFDASKRAEQELYKLGLIEKKEQEDVHDMLKAAALTYVAAFISTILNLLRLVLMLSGNKDD